MAHVLIMPRQGNTVESCIIVRWKVAEGAAVSADQGDVRDERGALGELGSIEVDEFHGLAGHGGRLPDLEGHTTLLLQARVECHGGKHHDEAHVGDVGARGAQRGEHLDLSVIASGHGATPVQR